MRFRARTLVLTLGLLGVAPAFAVGPGPIGSEFEVDGTESGFGDTAYHPLVYPEAGGEYVVLWNRYPAFPGAAYLRRYDAVGAPVAPASALNPTFAFVDAGRDAAGNFVLTYEDNDAYSGGTFGRRFDPMGNALAPGFQVNTTTGGLQEPKAIGVDASGAFMIVWESHPLDAFYGQVYDAAGSAVGGEFLVTSGDSSDPRIIGDDAGNFVVAWHDFTGIDTEVFARRYDGTGTPLGPQFQVNTYTTGFQSYPDMAAFGDGSFIIVWGGPGGGDPSGIFARRYDATGAPVGGEFAVNSYTTGGVGLPSVAVGGGGEFVIAWSGTVDIAEFSGVVARSFDNAGSPLGPDFRVNTYTEGYSRRQRAVLHPGGDFTVLWDTTGIGVRGQRFDATGTPYPGDVPLDGQRIVVRDRPDPTRRRLTFGSRDPSSANGITPIVRPDMQGMYLHVYNSATGDSACMPLPASGWDPYDGLEDPFFYRGPTNANGPCHKAKLIRNKRFQASCRGAGISYTLDEMSQGSVAVAAILGNARYCTVFGGTVAKDSGPDGVFKARNAPRPGTCPVPPVPCP